VTRYTPQVPMVETSAATTGASTAGSTILVSTPSEPDAQITPPQPSAATVAPMRPPNSACDELDGRPSNQVKTFQRIAPTNPAKTITSRSCPPTASSWTMPLATVAATATERKAPMRFSAAERATAMRGRSAPVAMEVAIALAVSWKPLVKSNVSAVAMTISSTSNSAVTSPVCGNRLFACQAVAACRAFTPMR